MTVDFSKILSHPDYEEVISKLTTGITPKDISDWLKLKYPTKEQSHLRLSSQMLKSFIDGHLDLYTDIRKEIIAAKTNQTIEKKVAASLKNNKTYEERVTEIAEEIGNKELDIHKYMGELVVIGKARLEQYFDKMQSNPENTKPDYGLIKWVETLGNLFEKYDKMINERPDQIIQHNINIQTANQYMAVLQDAIREVLIDELPEKVFIFMEKLSQKVAALDLPDHQLPSQNTRLAQAKLLHSKVMAETEEHVSVPEG